jgi:hypothetical protein
MNMHAKFILPEAVTSSVTAPTRSYWLTPLSKRLAFWLKTCVDRYAAATAYEHLSRLSDAELKHPGLSRDILGRDL